MLHLFNPPPAPSPPPRLPSPPSSTRPGADLCLATSCFCTVDSDWSAEMRALNWPKTNLCGKWKHAARVAGLCPVPGCSVKRRSEEREEDTKRSILTWSHGCSIRQYRHFPVLFCLLILIYYCLIQFFFLFCKGCKVVKHICASPPSRQLFDVKHIFARLSSLDPEIC